MHICRARHTQEVQIVEVFLEIRIFSPQHLLTLLQVILPKSSASGIVPLHGAVLVLMKAVGRKAPAIAHTNHVRLVFSELHRPLRGLFIEVGRIGKAAILPAILIFIDLPNNRQNVFCSYFAVPPYTSKLHC